MPSLIDCLNLLHRAGAVEIESGKVHRKFRFDDDSLILVPSQPSPFLPYKKVYEQTLIIVKRLDPDLADQVLHAPRSAVSLKKLLTQCQKERPISQSATIAALRVPSFRGVGETLRPLTFTTQPTEPPTYETLVYHPPRLPRSRTPIQHSNVRRFPIGVLQEAQRVFREEGDAAYSAFLNSHRSETVEEPLRMRHRLHPKTKENSPMPSTDPMDSLLERTRQRVQYLTAEIEHGRSKIKLAKELVTATEAVVGPQEEEKLKLEVFIETLAQTRTMADEIASILPSNPPMTRTGGTVRAVPNTPGQRIGVTRIFRRIILGKLVACGKCRFTAAEAIEMFQQEGHSVGKQAIYNALHSLTNEENALVTRDPSERGLYAVRPMAMNGAA